MKKVISVEDDNDMREILRRQLETLDLEVTTFANGTDFVSYFKNHPEKPDLMILDCRLPDASGPQLARYVRQLYDGPEIPIIFLSAETNLPELASEIKNAKYLAKPLKFKDLRGLLSTSSSEQKK